MKYNFVSWNCMSCFPQYYDTIKDIEKGNSSTSMVDNMKHNTQRYRNIIDHLEEFLFQVQIKKVQAIVLQEVDQELLGLLKKELKTHPMIVVHHHKPYMTYPQRSPPPHDFAYYLVTLYHKHNRHPTFKSLHYDRCLCTPLKTCTLFNVHIPWIAPNHSDYKKEKTTQTIASIALAMKSNPKNILIGDLNQSCPFNQKLYERFFNNTMYHRFVCGESYKLSPENVLGRKTFRSLPQTPDDGCIVHKSVQAHMSFTSIQRNRLSVDKQGWFLADQTNCFPSDHALFKVECIIPSHRSISKRTLKHFRPKHNHL